MPVLDDVLDYLTAQSTVFTKLAGTTGNIAKGTVLDTTKAAPETMLALYDTQGVASAFGFSTVDNRAAVEFEQPGLQLLSRSTSYKTARDNCVVAYQILDGLGNIALPTATGTKYLSIVAVQPPFFTGRDSDRRPLFSANFNIMKETT